MKILVVEDEVNLCRLYREELEEEGHTVLTAATAAAAMELFGSERPDIVTLDINLSHADEGFQLLRRMKEVRPAVPVIMLSAYDYRDDFAVWCADDYVVKSSDLSALMRIVRQAERKNLGRVDRMQAAALATIRDNDGGGDLSCARR